MCVFLISLPTAEPIRPELISTLVFHNLAPGPIYYRVSVLIRSIQKIVYVVHFLMI